jgi:hypothetical protein
MDRIMTGCQSVSVAGNGTLARLRRFGSDKEGVTLHAGHVRELSANGYRLDVAADPVDDDPDHALIVGFRHAIGEFSA